ncbi:MAG: hypothetical protein ABFC57_03325 [Veillonellales bacterium]
MKYLRHKCGIPSTSERTIDDREKKLALIVVTCGTTPAVIFKLYAVFTCGIGKITNDKISLS